MLELVKMVDMNILLFLHKTAQNPLFDWLMPRITGLGNAGIVWIVISLVLLFQRKYRRIGIMCIMALLLGAVIGEGILKHIVGRGRPFMSFGDIKLLIEKPTSYSFPSGHTTSSFAAATVLAGYFKRYRIPVFFLAALLAFSRMYLFVHYPSDILFGIILGVICARMSMKIGEKYLI